MASAASSRWILGSGPVGEARHTREWLGAVARRFGAERALGVKHGSDLRWVTFEQFGEMALDFAAGLARLGLRPGDKCILMLPNGIEWVVAWFGVSLVGAAAVPIYPELGTGDANSIAKQSDSCFAIASLGAISKLDHRHLTRVIAVPPHDTKPEEVAEALSRLGGRGIPFDEVGSHIADSDRDAILATDLRANDIATIVYTSGTMGDPKGVMLSHRNLLSNAISGLATINATPRDTVLCVLPLHHCYPFTAALVGPLSGGAGVFFENDLRRIRDRMGEVHPTIVFGVPALFAQIYRTVVARLENEGRLATFRRGEDISARIKAKTGVNVGRLIFRELHNRLGGRIRFFGSGGAALPIETFRRYSLLGIPLIQGWGLSEAAPVIAGQRINQAGFTFTRYFEETAGSVGVALPGVQISQIDVPDKGIYARLHGEGELLARGPDIMLGYYKNEAATREIMLDDWLRTGDIGRIDKNAHVYITGRAKSVIVLESGEKVYPDELEERFQSGGIVGDVCVIGRKPPRLLGDRRTQVCAIVYPDPIALTTRAKVEGERLTPELVRRWVEADVERAQSGMAQFKRISDIVLTDTPLPKTVLKKVRRGNVKDHYSFELERLLSQAE